MLHQTQVCNALKVQRESYNLVVTTKLTAEFIHTIGSTGWAVGAHTAACSIGFLTFIASPVHSSYL